jgi:hypothetical protein
VIVGTDIATVAPSGIVFVTADFVDRSVITGVQVGATILPLDSANVKWALPGAADAAHVLVVRIPASQSVGVAELTLVGPSGRSPAQKLTVVTPGPQVPPPLNGMILIPAGAADGDTFPIGTNAFAAGDPTGPNAGLADWHYSLTFADDGRQTTAAACHGYGRIAGSERHAGAPEGNEITGTYRLNATVNYIDMKIDRTLSGGGVEPYIGGWVAKDGSSAPHSVIKASTEAYIVVRSLRTGLQLTIAHEMNPTCHNIGWSPPTQL